MTNVPFDGLAKQYDEYRPRYPQRLFHQIGLCLNKDQKLKVLDLGAGTGIELEGLIPELGDRNEYSAVDISADMIGVGQKKFPYVQWHCGKAEEILANSTGIGLIVVAQAIQWMDRSVVFKSSHKSLNSGGIFAVLQNNRNYVNSNFLLDYETLLEEMSSGYKKEYRAHDYQSEIAGVFNQLNDSVIAMSTHWEMQVPVSKFIGMSQSSTQAQRAIKAHGEVFLDKLNGLVTQYAINDHVAVRYESQLIMGIKGNFETDARR